MFVNRDAQIQRVIATPLTSSTTRAAARCSTSIMFEAAGFSKQDIVKRYGLVGIPMVDTRAKFYVTSTHGCLRRRVVI
jgi:hypothetical protein